jgi:hypothetical protein
MLPARFSNCAAESPKSRARRARSPQPARDFLEVYRLRGSTLALEDRFSDTLEHEPEVDGSREMLQ